MIQLLDNIYAVPVELDTSKQKVYGMQLGFDFDILGTCTATEVDFDVEAICEKVIIRNDCPPRAAGFIDTLMYKNYEETDQYRFSFQNPELSFRSLLTSKGILFENPLGVKRPSFNDYSSLIQYQGDCEEYDESQKNVVEKIVIIKKL